jgi:hypothetical protein
MSCIGGFVAAYGLRSGFCGSKASVLHVDDESVQTVAIGIVHQIVAQFLRSGRERRHVDAADLIRHRHVPFLAERHFRLDRTRLRREAELRMRNGKVDRRRNGESDDRRPGHGLEAAAKTRLDLLEIRKEFHVNR